MLFRSFLCHLPAKSSQRHVPNKRFSLGAAVSLLLFGGGEAMPQSDDPRDKLLAAVNYGRPNPGNTYPKSHLRACSEWFGLVNCARETGRSPTQRPWLMAWAMTTRRRELPAGCRQRRSARLWNSCRPCLTRRGFFPVQSVRLWLKYHASEIFAGIENRRAPEMFFCQRFCGIER